MSNRLGADKITITHGSDIITVRIHNDPDPSPAV